MIRKHLLYCALLPLLAACQAMTPGTLAVKGDLRSGDSVVTSEKTDHTDAEDSPLAPPSLAPGPESPKPVSVLPPSGGDLPTTPAPAPSSPFTGSPSYVPASNPSGPVGPLAAGDDPMAPKADKDGAGGCLSAFFYTNGVRLEYAPGLFASVDPLSPTVLDDDGTFSGTLKLEVYLPVFADGIGDDYAYKTWSWFSRVEGYLRVIVTPGFGGQKTYVDIDLEKAVPAADAGSDALFRVVPANLALPALDVPYGARVAMHYYHVFPQGKTHRIPGTDEEECWSNAQQPPDYAPKPAAYTADIEARFNDEILYGREPGADQNNTVKLTHPAAHFRVPSFLERIRYKGVRRVDKK